MHELSILLQEMALFKEVRPLQAIPAELVKPLKPNTPTRLALSQLELLERLLKDLGTDNSGFTADNVMQVRTWGRHSIQCCVSPQAADVCTLSSKVECV